MTAKENETVRQSQEEMDSETYAKELTSEQYDRIMNAINDSILRAAQDTDPLSEYQTVNERKENQE